VRHRRVLARRANLNHSNRALLGVGETVRHERVDAYAALVRLERRLEYDTPARRP